MRLISQRTPNPLPGTIYPDNFRTNSATSENEPWPRTRTRVTEIRNEGSRDHPKRWDIAQGRCQSPILVADHSRLTSWSGSGIRSVTTCYEHEIHNPAGSAC